MQSFIRSSMLFRITQETGLKAYIFRREYSFLSVKSLCKWLRPGTYYYEVSKGQPDTSELSCKCGSEVRFSKQKRYKSTEGSHKARENSSENNEGMDDRSYTHHFVEPPDPESNLRRIKFATPKKPNLYDEQLVKEREEAFQWNHEFWTKHNKKFFEEKKAFSRRMEESKSSTPEKDVSDEMSKFYKDFLDRHYQMHMDYNRNWYKRNFGMLFLAIRASLKRTFQSD